MMMMMMLRLITMMIVMVMMIVTISVMMMTAGQLLSRLPPRNMLSRRWLTTDIQQRNLNKEGVHSRTTIFRD